MVTSDTSTLTRCKKDESESDLVVANGQLDVPRNDALLLAFLGADVGSFSQEFGHKSSI